MGTRRWQRRSGISPRWLEAAGQKGITSFFLGLSLCFSLSLKDSNSIVSSFIKTTSISYMTSSAPVLSCYHYASTPECVIIVNFVASRDTLPRFVMSHTLSPWSVVCPLGSALCIGTGPIESAISFHVYGINTPRGASYLSGHQPVPNPAPVERP